MQLELVSNVFRTLENQTNKNFEVIFLMNPVFFDNPRYEFLFSELKKATTLPLKLIKSGTMNVITENTLNELDDEDFIIHSRMDFDDFVYKDAVADTQSKVNECENVLCYGYCRGYSYLEGDLLPHYYLFNGLGHLGILQSLIVKASFAKKLPMFSVYLGSHNKFKNSLKNFLAKNGVEFSENMFQQNTSTNAYIYFRHECARFVLTQNRINPTITSQKENKLTTEDITKKQLEEEFGFNYKLNSID